MSEIQTTNYYDGVCERCGCAIIACRFGRRCSNDNCVDGSLRGKDCTDDDLAGGGESAL